MNLEDFAKYRKAVDEGKKTLASVLESKLVADNRLLAMQLCNRYRQGLAKPLNMADSEQAALTGMLRALRKYDPSKGTFSNLAGWWVRHELQVAGRDDDRLMDGLTGRKRRKTNRRIEAFIAANGRVGSPEAMGVTVEDLAAFHTEPRYVRETGNTKKEGRARGAEKNHDWMGSIIHSEDPTPEEAMIAREEAFEAIDKVPSSRQIPVWALAQRPAFQRLTASFQKSDRRILEDLAKTGDTPAVVARRHRKTKAYVLKVCKEIEAQVRDFWHEEDGQ